MANLCPHLSFQIPQENISESLFFLKKMKLYKDICSALISCTFAETSS